MTNDRPLPSLSTMWAVQPRFERDLGAFLDRAAELGYEAVEINHSMTAEQAGAIMGYSKVGGGRMPVTGVHAPAPLERHPSAGWNREMNPAALEETERALAVQYHRASIALAAEAGTTQVIVHLGGAGSRLLAGERKLRSMYDRRASLPVEWNTAIDETVRERAAMAAPWLAQARKSLDEMAETAAAHGVTLAIETRLHYHEFPLPFELADLLSPYPLDIAGYQHDVGHAEVHHRLGLTDKSAWWDLLGPRLVGLHLHDVRGLTDHRAPGNGDVDYAWLAERIAAAPASAARTFEIDQHESYEDTPRGLVLMQEHGIV